MKIQIEVTKNEDGSLNVVYYGENIDTCGIYNIQNKNTPRYKRNSLINILESSIMQLSRAIEGLNDPENMTEDQKFR